MPGLRKIFLAAFILFYLAVSQLHPLIHWHSMPDDGSSADIVQLVESISADELPQVWRSRMDSHCPGDFSSDRQAHHSCNCSMLQFTVQQKFENSIVLALIEHAFPPLDRIDTQYYPRGLNPPPKVS